MNRHEERSWMVRIVHMIYLSFQASVVTQHVHKTLNTQFEIHSSIIYITNKPQFGPASFSTANQKTQISSRWLIYLLRIFVWFRHVSWQTANRLDWSTTSQYDSEEFFACLCMCSQNIHDTVIIELANSQTNLKPPAAHDWIQRTNTHTRIYSQSPCLTEQPSTAYDTTHTKTNTITTKNVMLICIIVLNYSYWFTNKVYIEMNANLFRCRRKSCTINVE